MNKVFIVLCLLFLGLALRGLVFATNDDKVYWCHCAESGVCNTLHLPLQALTNAGHVNASGNPLHAGDYAGECQVNVHSPTPSLQDPTSTPSSTLSPTDTQRVTDTPTLTPTTFHPSATPFHPSATPQITSANAVNEHRGQPELGGFK